MEDLITCSNCSGDACYVTQVTPEMKNYFCMGCGYQTNTLMKKGEQFFEEQFAMLPDIYKALMGEDDEGKIWMPTFIDNDKGMVYASGKNTASWKWSAVKKVEVSEEDRKKYPIPGKTGEFYKTKADMTTLKQFDEKDFMDALEYLGMLDGAI
jgi:hypothetical protein